MKGIAQGRADAASRLESPLEFWLANRGRRPGPWLAVVAVLFAVQISPWWYATPDTVVYLSMARSIATAHHIRAFGNAQTGLPPGYPLLISPAFLFGERPFLAVSVIHWVMAVVLTVGLYRWFRRSCPPAALLLTGLVMVNVSVWISYRRALSELAFMTVLVWTVAALNAVFDTKSTFVAFRRGVVGAALLILLSLIREVGVLCGAGFAAVALVSVLRRKVRWPVAIAMTLIVALPAAIAVAGFLQRDVALKAASLAPLGTHIDGWLDPPATTLAERLSEGMRLRISDVGQLLVPGMFNAYGRKGDWVDINVAIYVALFALVALGWWRLVRRRPEVFALTLPFYLLAYVVWAFAGGARYALPMLPVILASAWCIIEPLQRQRLRLLAILLAAHLAVAIGYWVVEDIPRARACTAQWGAVEQLAAAVQRDRGGVRVSSVPECVGLMLGFTLDRAVPVLRDGGADGSASWIVVPDGEPPPPGFSVALHAVPYDLLVRDDAR